MIKNVQIISKHSQVMELANDLKFGILRQLISSAATCQQLATALRVSKQKVHYHLNQLLKENMIVIEDGPKDNGKEVYYRATAKNYILDFALGEHLHEGTINGRGIIQSIMESEYKLSLSNIARRILQDSLKLKSRQKLLIVTGKYNLPLVEKILLEAGKMNVRTTLLYQDKEMLKAKYEEYSLPAFNADYEHFNRLLKGHNVYLNLNGEARHLQLSDPAKLGLRKKHFYQSAMIIAEKKIGVAMMPGLLNDTISERAIESELQFWKALDIDYKQLSEDTLNACDSYATLEKLSIRGNGSDLSFSPKSVMAEAGSFSDHPRQCPTINYPGGEVLMLPLEGSMNGLIKGDVAYAFGESIQKPCLRIEENEIKSFSAETNENLLKQAIEAGGEDGAKVALVCLGTNPYLSLGHIDLSFRQKARGLLSIYWGDNRSLGGSVAGSFEWFMELENPMLTSHN